MSNNTIIPHPTSHNATKDRLHERENLARQLRSTQMMREQAREQINPTEIITSLIEIDTKLMGEEDAAGNPIPLEKEIIAQLNARANIKFKLLSKVLPDLKATESVSYSAHDHNHNHQHKQVDDLELIARLRLFKKNHLDTASTIKTVPVEPTPEEPTAPEGGSIKLVADYDFL